MASPTTCSTPPTLARKFGRLSGLDGIGGTNFSDPDGIRGDSSVSGAAPACHSSLTVSARALFEGLTVSDRVTSHSLTAAAAEAARTPASDTVKSGARNPIRCRRSPSTRCDAGRSLGRAAVRQTAGSVSAVERTATGEWHLLWPFQGGSARKWLKAKRGG